MGCLGAAETRKECTSTVIGRQSGRFFPLYRKKTEETSITEDGEDFDIWERREVKSMGALWLGFGG